MEAIVLGIAIGASGMLAVKNGRAGAKRLVGWAARQAGWISGRVNGAIEDARRAARKEYERGREENLARTAEMPPPSSRGGSMSPASQRANGTH